MVGQSKKIEILLLVLITEIFTAITVLFLTAKNIELMSYLLYSLASLLIVASLYTSFTTSFLLSICTVFGYSSYLLYQIIGGNQGIILARENYVWLLVFPALSLTAGKLGENLQKIQKEQKRLEAELSQLIHVDPVTNLNNKNRFYVDLNEEMAKAKRHQQPLSVMLIQIQYFNELKSLYKKEEVDHVLETLAESINSVMRTEDKKYSLEDGSFSVLLPFTDFQGAELVKNRLKSRLEDLSIHTKSKNKALNFNFKMAVKQYKPEESDNPLQIKKLLEKELEYDV